MSNPDDARSALRKRYLEVSTPTVSDVLEKLGYMDQVLFSKIKPVTVGRVAGWAYTVSGRMARYEGEGGDPEKLEACEGIGPNEVSVWSGGGSGICYFGDLVSASMQQRGSTGAVLDGGIRDTAALEEIGFATFATYQSSAQSIGRWKVDEWQVPITLPGATTENVQITPGDFITGDQDGVVVVPSGMEEEVINNAESLEESDRAIREALVDGMSASEARAKFGHL